MDQGRVSRQFPGGERQGKRGLAREFHPHISGKGHPAIGTPNSGGDPAPLLDHVGHTQGGALNQANLARGLGIDGKTVSRYLDLLVDLLLVRRLSPFQADVGKRLSKSTRIYVRDAGIVHALLGLEDLDAVLGHPVVGGSWEGFVVETLLGATQGRVKPWFFRTAGGAEVDLLLEMPNGRLWAIEIKRSLAPKPEKGFHHARQDLGPERAFIVYPGDERYPRGDGLEVIGLWELVSLLAAT